MYKWEFDLLDIIHRYDILLTCPRGLTLHSGRIGGATEAAAAGVSRADIKRQGGWASNAVDLYIQPKDGDTAVSKALMRKMRI